MTFEQIKEIILKYGLTPGLNRDISLFGSSVIMEAYTNGQKETLGFAYNGMAAISVNGSYHSMVNEDYVAEEVSKLLDSSADLELIFKKAFKTCSEAEQKVEDNQQLISKDPKKFLRFLTEIYAGYLSGLSIYNSFYRFLNKFPDHPKLSPQWVERLASERNIAGRLYPRLEEMLKEAIDDDLIRYFTLDEMGQYLKDNNFFKEKKEELEKRKVCYFQLHLTDQGKKYLFTDITLIEKIDQCFFQLNSKEKILTLKGQSAFPGLVKGVVAHAKTAESKKDFILVASHTNPKDLAIIKKSLAIITDEGGVLSHAAIMAREFKKPCIIGTKIATKVLKDGDMVEVDANKGIVKILN